jgi:alpha-1,3-rhamnosyltransferase
MAGSCVMFTSFNESNPLISVLIPLYNRADYITKTLDSLLNDSYPNTEILVLDDGSTDNSFSVVQQWASQHTHVKLQLKTRPNKGLAQTIHELIGWCLWIAMICYCRMG